MEDGGCYVAECDVYAEYGGDSLRLYSVYPFRRKRAAEIGILAEPVGHRAVKRTADHSRVRREQRVIAAFGGDKPGGSADLAHKLSVK